MCASRAKTPGIVPAQWLAQAPSSKSVGSTTMIVLCCIKLAARAGLHVVLFCPSSMSQLFAPGRAFRIPRRLPLTHAAAAATRCSSTSSSLAAPSIAVLLSQNQLQDLSSSPPQSLTLNGFVRSVRKQKRVAFAAIGDGSSLRTVQAVLTPEQADGLSTGVAVAVTGHWAPSPGTEQSFELQADSVRVLGHNDAATSPLQKKYQTPEFLRTLPHLRARLPFNALLLRLRSQVTAQATNYFTNHGFVQAHPPIITSSDCEGAGEVFTIAPESSSNPKQPGPRQELFFGSPKYLTVSSQLHLEALAHSVGKVWTLSPTFRAEKSDTARHLSEFYMLEAEVAFVDNLTDVMDVVEGLLRTLATELQCSKVGQELLEARARDDNEDGNVVSSTVLVQRWQGLMGGPWPRITYQKALEHLASAVARGEAHFEFAPGHEDGLQTEHERFLAESLGGGGPIFVTDYPRDIKPFYMAPSKETPTGADAPCTVACFDLLVPDICELVGGSMREHGFPELLKSMEDQGLQTSGTSDGSLQWYLDLRRYGSVPHGGFGLGFDRLLCYLSGVTNIRDVVSFPRWHKRCDC